MFVQNRSLDPRTRSNSVWSTTSVNSDVSSTFDNENGINNTNNINNCTTNSSRQLNEVYTNDTLHSVSSTDIDFDPKTSFLQYIDPFPVLPPDYKFVNPSMKRSLHYPIFESNHNPRDSNDLPPLYTAAVNEFTIVSLRVEFQTPTVQIPQFQSKIWRNFILEINSTQLNLYYIDPKLTKFIKDYSPGFAPRNPFYTRKQCTEFNRENHYELLMSLINENKSQYINDKNLFKSYSLQFGKFGLPLDYLWKQLIKSNVYDIDYTTKIPDDRTLVNLIDLEDEKYLRIRCEQEQLLIRFIDVDEMLNWARFLSTGINVSLDLEIREFPNYKIVPRRRRRRRELSRFRKLKKNPIKNKKNLKIEPSNVYSNNHSYYSTSSPTESSSPNSNDSLVSKLKKLFVSSKQSKVSTKQSNVPKNSIKIPTVKRNKTNITTPLHDTQSSNVNEPSTASSHEEEQEQEQEEEEEEEVNSLDIDTTSILSSSSTHSNSLELSTSTSSSDTSDSSLSYLSSDVDHDEDTNNKWVPYEKPLTRKRYLSESIRCIPPLFENKSWIGRILSKELPPPDYRTNNMPIFYDGQEKNNFNFKIKNHYLGSYIVTQNGLIKGDTEVISSWNQINSIGV